MDYLRQVEEERQRRSVEAFEEYRVVQLKGVVAGGLDPADVTRLVDLAELLGKNGEQMAADRQALIDRRTAASEAAKLGEASAECNRANAINVEFRTKRERIMAELHGEGQKCDSDLENARHKLTVADNARGRLRNLDGTHWRLFGLPDPSTIVQKFHLVNVFHGQMDPAPAAGCETIDFSRVVACPDVIGDMEAAELVKHPDQSEEEFAELKALAMEIYRTRSKGGNLAKKSARYLLPTGFNGRELTGQSLHTVGFGVAWDTTWFDPDSGYAWLRHPDQTQEDLDALLAKLRKRYEKLRKQELAGEIYR